MALMSATDVTCPHCGKSSSVQLVRSLNSQTDAGLKDKLLKGELNVLACGCGKRSPLAADLVFHDPVTSFFCQVCVGDEAAVARGKRAFKDAGVEAGRRIVRTLNGLVEKVKLNDAGLEDWAIEMTKVLLLASLPTPLIDALVLFDGVDREKGLLSWVLFASGEDGPRFLTSPLGPYERGLKLWRAVAPTEEYEIERAWALAALRKVMPLPS